MVMAWSGALRIESCEVVLLSNSSFCVIMGCQDPEQANLR